MDNVKNANECLNEETGEEESGLKNITSEFCNGLSNLVGEFSSHLMELASQEAQFRLHLNEKLGQRISVGQQIEENIAQVNSTIHSFLHSLGMSIPPSTDDMDE